MPSDRTKVPSFPDAGLDPATRRWLEYEQTLNQRRFPSSGNLTVAVDGKRVDARWRPEQRNVWPQEVVWLPAERARTYGQLDESFGGRDGCIPLFLHPQPTREHRRIADLYGASPFDDLRATPTASFRSLLAWRTSQAPFILKLSLGATVARARRALPEDEIASGVMISAIVDTIDSTEFDTFRERFGMVDTESGEGWLLREMPQKSRDYIPMFSLVAPRGNDAPILVEMIRRDGCRPETFVLERVLAPYVSVLSSLLFEEGIQIEGHAQNILMELDGDRLTGRVVLRDFSDATVNIATRIARGRPLPVPSVPHDAPFAVATIAGDHRCRLRRALPLRARDTIVRYGLGAFVWLINTSIAGHFRRYDAGRVARGYLRSWQQETIEAVAIRPQFRESPPAIAIDESISWTLCHTDWDALGATQRAALPPGAERLRIVADLPRRRGPAYRKLECAWGDLYLDGDTPAFFRPAF